MHILGTILVAAGPTRLNYFISGPSRPWPVGCLAHVNLYQNLCCVVVLASAKVIQYN